MNRRAAATLSLALTSAGVMACAALTGAEDLREAPGSAAPPGSMGGVVGGGGTSGAPAPTGTTGAEAGDGAAFPDDDAGRPASDAGAPDITSCQATGLVAYWQMSEGQGKIAHDCSGNGNDATLPDNVTWTTGRSSGGALQFPGRDPTGGGGDDSLTIAPSAGLEGTGELTVFAWLDFPADDTSGRSGLIGRGPGGMTPDWWLWAQNGRIRGTIAVADVAAFVGVASTSLIHPVWMSVALVFRPSSPLALWVNGAREGSSIEAAPAALAAASEGTVRIGRVGASPNDIGGFAGKMQQVRIFSRALADQEIATLAKEP